MTSALIDYDPDNIPIELRTNPLHPAADQYIQYLQKIQLAIVDASNVMNMNKVQAVKHFRMGLNYKEIAAEIGRSAGWVSKILKEPESKRLNSLLAFYASALGGPKEEQRVSMLWRIARDNEKLRPNTSILANAEITKMQGGGVVAPVVPTVVINQNLFPRGALD